MTLQRTRITLSVADYLAAEMESDVRHEYVNGEVFAMVGASDRRNIIAGNSYTLLNGRLPDQCQVFMSDMKVRIRAGRETKSIINLM